MAKLAANRDRDADTDRQLRDTGWTVLRFFEHEDMAAAAQTVIDQVMAVRRRDL